MKIVVKVKPNSREESVNKTADNEFIVRVKAPAKEGKANEAVIALLRGYLNIPKSDISLIRGHKSKNKIFDINLRG